MSTVDLTTIWPALQTVNDPELGYNIVDLGLVYAVTVDQLGAVLITMTLTTPVCPLQAYFLAEIAKALQTIPGLSAHHVEFTFTPPWSLSKAVPDIQQHFALLGIPLSRF